MAKKPKRTRAAGAGRPTPYPGKEYRFSIVLTEVGYQLAVKQARAMGSTISNAIEKALRGGVDHELLEACQAVVGRGYLEADSQTASQDYVSKRAIGKVRAAIEKALREAK